MRFRINLASEPYEDARRFYLRWGAALVLMVIVTGALVYLAVAGWRHSHLAGSRIAAEKANLDKLTKLEQQDLAILNKPENREVRDKSQVLNGLIRRKQFSWTLIFSDLEHLMPSRLHVLSINPQLDKNNDISVRMVVAGDSREKAIELVQNMEKSREFRGARVISESEFNRRDQNSPGFADTVQFEIRAQYVPVAPTPAPAQERSGQ